MSGRGGRGGARGRGAGRGGFAGTLPTGLTFADIQQMSREGSALYPEMKPPVMTEASEKEKKIAQIQIEFTAGLQKSEYYVVESTKSTGKNTNIEINRRLPKLKPSDLHAPFFPAEMFEAYFNPKKKAKARRRSSQKKKLNLDAMLEDDENNDSEKDGSDNAGSQGEPDYDTQEEYDNDYADNYFDNGEGEDFDDLGDGHGRDDGGGGGDYE
ncbi:hypothetical protein D9757_004150 [Collybiopsis confluens]|uniref:DNA-directed RNA polymerase III subunit n=1 Tax=Collybiopsis confluens TaxID=2823264 RepID=A0A8H5HUD4_9AGAR|nr:hypothetical protein D9757_004150 [Collybiopsis confluens]